MCPHTSLSLGLNRALRVAVVSLACLAAACFPALAAQPPKHHHHHHHHTKTQPTPPSPTTSTPPPLTTTTPPPLTTTTPPPTTTPYVPLAPAATPVAPVPKRAAAHTPRPPAHRAEKHVASPPPSQPPRANAERAADTIADPGSSGLPTSLIVLVLLGLAGSLAVVAVGTKFVRARRFAGAESWREASQQVETTRREEPRIAGYQEITNHDRLRVYGYRIRMAIDERGLEVAFVGVGLVAAILLGALIGGM